jgi:hypothetical protein
MKKLSRRTVVSTLLPAVALGVMLPAAAKAADQPHMQDALDALQKAHRELEQATTDKGGHRTKAMRLVRQAINEVEKGIKFDRRH